MRPRYVVQVIDDTPSAQPVAPPVPQISPAVSTATWERPAVPSAAPVENTGVVSRLAVHQPERGAGLASSTVVDLFERAHDVEALLQESQVADVREEPKVETPSVPKRFRTATEKKSRESAFVDTVQQRVHAEKIERFYQQRITPPVAKPSSGGSNGKGRRVLPSWLQMPRVPLPTVRFRSSRLTTAFLITAGILFCVGGASAWGIRQDLLATKSTVQLLASELEEGKFASARDRVQYLQRKQKQYSWVYEYVRPPIRLVLGDEKTTALDKSFTLAQSGLEIAQNGLGAFDQFHMGYEQFLGKKEGETIQTLQSASGELEALYTQLSSLQAEVQQFQNPFGWELIPELQKRVGETLPNMRRGVLAAQQLTDVLPELLGEHGKRTYLVLLQNNAELRPTGGFIGSFGLLTVEKGKFVDFSVEDVYEADGQLNGYVQPPPEIVEHLGEASWFLRDVNWSPDFPTVAEQAKWFVNKEIRVKPDGVIGVNLAVAQKILEVTGPVKLVDYGDEIITKDNLYQRAQMHAEIHFFPGSNQKKDFLSAVTDQLYLRLTEGEVNELALLRALYESAEESQFLVALSEPKAMQALNLLGWSGSLRTPECPSVFQGKTCVVDTVMQVEANLGVNKANQFIERSIVHTAKIESDKVVHQRFVALKNTSTSNAWPEGPYKAYFRLFVPAQSELVSVKVNGQNVPAQNIRQTDELGKRGFGFLVNTPVASTSMVEITYQQALPASSPLVYALFEQKQSGTFDDDVKHTIQVAGRKVQVVAPEPKDQRGGFTFVSDRARHTFYAVELE